MEYRRLGKTGLQISELSFGSWLTFGRQIGDNIAEQCMKLAYDNGVNFFDNAEGYAYGKAEEVMGDILKKMGWKRSSYLISTKVYFGAEGRVSLPNQTGLSRKHVFEACHGSLKRLQLDYLDLFLCHRPDSKTPIEETVWAMHQLIMQGKVLYWGTSEWSAQQIMEAHGVAQKHHLIAPSIEQVQYNMLTRERFEKEYERLYGEIGLGTAIWSPLASGLLSGKYNSGFKPETRLSLQGLDWLKEGVMEQAKIEKVKKLAELAKEIGTTMNRLAIAWCLKNPNVSTAILGASKVEQLEDNLKSLEVLPKLTAEVMERIEKVLDNKPVLPQY